MSLGPPARARASRFTNWLVTKAAGCSERKSSRRGFLIGSAMAGSAVAVAGLRRRDRSRARRTPTSPTARGGLCTDGYTEFCCTHQQRAQHVPARHFAGGWWRADYSSFCNGTRYYIDCMQNCCGPNLGNGFCAGCTECRCAYGCDTRRGVLQLLPLRAVPPGDRHHRARSRAGSSRAPRRTPTRRSRAAPRPRSTTHRRARARARPARRRHRVAAAVLPSPAPRPSPSPVSVAVVRPSRRRRVYLARVRRRDVEERADPAALVTSGVSATRSELRALRVRSRGTDTWYWYNRSPTAVLGCLAVASAGSSGPTRSRSSATRPGVYVFGRGSDGAVWYARHRREAAGRGWSRRSAGPRRPIRRRGQRRDRRATCSRAAPTRRSGTDASSAGARARGPSLGGAATSDPSAASTPCGITVFIRGAEARSGSRLLPGVGRRPWAGSHRRHRHLRSRRGRRRRRGLVFVRGTDNAHLVQPAQRWRWTGCQTPLPGASTTSTGRGQRPPPVSSCSAAGPTPRSGSGGSLGGSWSGWCVARRRPFAPSARTR